VARFFVFRNSTNTLSLMNQPAIRLLAVTRQPGFAVLADSWRAPVRLDGTVQPRSIAVVDSTVESQRIKTHAGGWTGAIAR
jgi:hypothetical protein